MSNLQHCIYAAIVRLHPAEFRNEFGREMVLDFEDALAESGFAGLCLDAILSLRRQWARCLVSGGADRDTAVRSSLLAGQYVMIREDALTPFELGRGLVVSVMLLALFAFAQLLGPGHLSRMRVVNAMTGASGSPDGNVASAASGNIAASCYVLVQSKKGFRYQKEEPADANTKMSWPDLNHVQYTAMPISGLVPLLSYLLNCPVADETGLTGRYDFSLVFARDSSPNDSLPPIFTALQTQLGLELQPN